MKFPEIKPYTVSGLNREIKNLLETEFFSAWVEGEVSNLRTPFSGHSYFTLKDAASQLKAVLFKGQKALVPFDLEDGQQVMARGRVTVYEPRGDYQLIVDYVEPKGYGALQKAFEQLKEKLSKEGLFDEQFKKPIPFLPEKIGIVTSSTGAAIRDILQILERRFPGFQALIAPVKVQGEGAAAEIAEAIRDLNAHGEADVLIVGRGGGSLEDLWAFNEEVVARAIFESRIPVVSAVGHEIDFTIADFTADLRAPTPSAAAELVVPNKEDLAQTISSHGDDLIRAMRHIVETYRESLENFKGNRIFREPKKLFYEPRQRLDYLALELERNTLQLVEVQRNRFTNLSRSLELLSPSQRLRTLRDRIADLYRALQEKINRIVRDKQGLLEMETKRLDALSPLAVISRGFSLCRAPDKTIIREISQVKIGDPVNLLLHKGELLCRVEGKKE
jgi:exodeoxyribonuclease VII large subunit